MTDKEEWKLPWLPSNDVQRELAKYNYFPHVRVMPRFTTKDVELRLQKTRSSAGAKMQYKLGGMPIDHVVTRDEMDKLWLSMLGRVRRMIDHEDLPEEDDDADSSDAAGSAVGSAETDDDAP